MTSKGKSPESMLLPNPPAGSANPTASLSSLWGYITPALDHIMSGPTNDDSKAPAIQLDYYARIHSHIYNYFTAQSEASNSLPLGLLNGGAAGMDREFVSGNDLYAQLDRYYAQLARDYFLGAPQDDSSLIHYIIPCFNRYSAGAQAVNRLLNYVNRHYVKRAVDEDKGWLRLADVLESVSRSITIQDTREQVAQKMRQKKTDELKKWGYRENTDGEGDAAARAEACAEAASPVDRVIPLSSLAHRRFRTELIEPLLTSPKLSNAGKKGKKKIPKPTTNGSGPPLPKGRLARAVSQLLDVSDGDEAEKARLAADLSRCLLTVGIKNDNPLRKKLDKYTISHPLSPSPPPHLQNAAMLDPAVLPSFMV